MITLSYLFGAGLALLCTLAASAAIEQRDSNVFAYCDRLYDPLLGDWDDITLYGIGWGNNTNANKQYKGCGLLTEWRPVTLPSNFTIADNSNGDNKGKVFKPDWGLTFTLPIAVKQNCMGRAVASSGGPHMKCEQHQ